MIHAWNIFMQVTAACLLVSFIFKLEQMMTCMLPYTGSHVV